MDRFRSGSTQFMADCPPIHDPADIGRNVPRPEFACRPLRKRGSGGSHQGYAEQLILIRPKSQGAKKVPSGEPLKSTAKRSENRRIEGVRSRTCRYKLSATVAENSIEPRRDRWRAAMQEIADWLDKLGMSQYAQRFA